MVDNQFLLLIIIWNVEHANQMKTFKKQFKQTLADLLDYTEYGKFISFNTMIKDIDKLQSIQFDITEFDKYAKDSDNIKKLFNLKHTVMNDGSIVEVKYKLNDVINLYNEINNTRLYTLDEKDFYIYLKMNEKPVEYFVVDMTPLYKLINTELNTDVVYKIKVKNEKETDTSLIITKLK